MPFQKVLAEMGINGFLVDKDKALKMRDFVSKLLIEKKIKLCKSANLKYEIQTLLNGEVEVLPSINFNSTPQMVALIEGLGMEITELTKPSKRFPKGQKSVGKETIRRLSGQHLFIKAQVFLQRNSCLIPQSTNYFHLALCQFTCISRLSV